MDRTTSLPKSVLRYLSTQEFSCLLVGETSQRRGSNEREEAILVLPNKMACAQELNIIKTQYYRMYVPTLSTFLRPIFTVTTV